MILHSPSSHPGVSCFLHPVLCVSFLSLPVLFSHRPPTYNIKDSARSLTFVEPSVAPCSNVPDQLVEDLVLDDSPAVLSFRLPQNHLSAVCHWPRVVCYPSVESKAPFITSARPTSEPCASELFENQDY